MSQDTDRTANINYKLIAGIAWSLSCVQVIKLRYKVVIIYIFYSTPNIDCTTHWLTSDTKGTITTTITEVRSPSKVTKRYKTTQHKTIAIYRLLNRKRHLHHVSVNKVPSSTKDKTGQKPPRNQHYLRHKASTNVRLILHEIKDKDESHNLTSEWQKGKRARPTFKLL